MRGSRLSAATIVACVVIGLALSACGGSNTTTIGKAARTAKAAYIAKADVICSAERRQMSSITMPVFHQTATRTVITTNVAAIQHQLRKVLAISQTMHTRLMSLPRPAAFRSQLDRIWTAENAARRRQSRYYRLYLALPSRITLLNVNHVRNVDATLATRGNALIRLSFRLRHTLAVFGFKSCAQPLHLHTVGKPSTVAATV